MTINELYLGKNLKIVTTSQGKVETSYIFIKYSTKVDALRNKLKKLVAIAVAKGYKTTPELDYILGKVIEHGPKKELRIEFQKIVRYPHDYKCTITITYTSPMASNTATLNNNKHFVDRQMKMIEDHFQKQIDEVENLLKHGRQ